MLCWQLRLILHVSTRVTTRFKVSRQAINNRVTVTASAAEEEEVGPSMVAVKTVRPKSVLVIKIPTSRAVFAGAVVARARVRPRYRSLGYRDYQPKTARVVVKRPTISIINKFH